MITKEGIYEEDFWRRRDLSLNELQILDKKKTDWNKTNNEGYLPLHLALMGTNNEEIIEFVLEKTNSKNMNAIVPEHFNWNCLFFALRYNHSFNTFKKLIERSANLKQLNEDEHTLLVQARKNKQVLQYLLQIDDGFLAKNESESCHALTNALYDVSDAEVFELILQFGAKLNHLDEDGENLLFLASRGRNVKAVKFLLEHGSKEIFNIPNNEGETIHDYLAKAESNKALQIIRELIAKELPEVPNVEMEQYLLGANTSFDIDESLSSFKLSECDEDEHFRKTIYTHHGKLEEREDEYDPISQTHIDLRELPVDFEQARTIINNINAETAKKDFAFTLRFRGIPFQAENIVLKETYAQGIERLEGTLEADEAIYFYAQLKVKKIVNIFAIAYSKEELSKIQYLTHNLKITTINQPDTDNNKEEIPTWEDLPSYISNFPFAEKDLFTVLVQEKEKEGCIYISDEEADFDKTRVKSLVEKMIKQTDKIEQKLYDFAIEMFEAIDWELEENISKVTDDPKILNADEKTQFLYMMNITGVKGILSLHNNISVYLDIDESEQYSITVTFYSEWEEEHGCVFSLKEGEELICGY